MWATAPVMITVCVVFSGAVELMRQNREALEISNEDSEQKSDMKVAKTELAPQAEVSQKSQAHQALTLAKQCLETADTEMIKAEAMAADVAARELEIDQKLKEAKARLALATEKANVTEKAVTQKAGCKQKHWGCHEGAGGGDMRCCDGLFCDTTTRYQADWHGSGYCKTCVGEDQSCGGERKCCTGYFCDPTVGSGTCKAWGMGKYSKSHCMSMKLCYDELPENMTSDKTWECACVWGQKQNDPMCKPWHDCVETKKAQEGETFKWLLKAVVGLEEGKHAFAQNTSQNMAAVQESADQACEDNEAIIAGWKKNTCALQAAIPGRCNRAQFIAKGACAKTCGWCQATATTEPAGSTEATEADSQLHCQNPTTMDIMAVECECGASKRKECEGSANPQECWEGVICNHPGVCDSWKLKWCPSATIEQLLDQGPVDDAASLDEAMTGKRSC